jgi:hypothetical protein
MEDIMTSTRHCISVKQLFALAQNQPLGGETERIRAHLDAGCAACRSRLEQLQTLLAATAGRHLLKAPDWLIHQAMSLFAWHQARARESRPEPVPAFLLIDSFAQGPLLGFRSAGTMSRQMLYRAGNYNINLSLNYVERARAIDIMGQPVPLKPGGGLLVGADVELLKESSVACATKSNEFGSFILNRVPEGIYDVRIKSAHEELDIWGLQALVRPH